MDYDINRLLIQFGLADLFTKQHLKWHYVDATDADTFGAAEARFDHDGRVLSIDLKHVYTNQDDLDGPVGEKIDENISLRATRIGDTDTFKISRLIIDGIGYEGDDAMLTLAAGLYYARALNISDIMITQQLNTARAKAEAQRETEQNNIRAAQHDSILTTITESAADMTAAPSGLDNVVAFIPRSDAPFAHRKTGLRL